MKVMIILNDLGNGGVERVLSTIANYLCSSHMDVSILAISSSKISYKISENINYKFVPVKTVYSKIPIAHEIKGMLCILKEIKKENPHWLIGFDDSIIIRFVPGAWLLRKKILVSERIDPSIYKNPIVRLLRYLSYNMANIVVFQTPDAQSFFSKRIQKKSVIIPNPLKKNLPIHDTNSNNDIIMACRLRAQKNIYMAIDAYYKLRQEYPDYRLVIYGEGQQKEELQQYANHLGLSGHVVFPGYTNHIHEKMKECRIYISSSDYEGISNSMLEALAIGVPSVVTDCPVGGARMFIKTNINGILVPVGNAELMYRGMKRIIENPLLARKLSINATRIRETLSSDIICNEWKQLIK